MVLYFVRHGEPDYKTDSLLPEGQRQAELVAERLKHAPISEIYSSPMGRAQETAKPLADALNLPVNIEPWAYELGDEFKYTNDEGVRKRLSTIPNAEYFSPEYRDIKLDRVFDEMPRWTQEMKQRYRELSEGLDNLLLRQGYRRTEDDRYLCETTEKKSVALFCHCGMQRVMLSHIFGIPYQFVAHTLMTFFTGVTVLYFPEKEGEPVIPSLLSYGDVGHLYKENDVLHHHFEDCVF